MNAPLVKRYPIHDRWSLLWLLIGTVIGMFGISIGNWIIPIAAWLSPIFIIRFMRTQRRLWLAYLVSPHTLPYQRSCLHAWRQSSARP